MVGRGLKENRETCLSLMTALCTAGKVDEARPSPPPLPNFT